MLQYNDTCKRKAYVNVQYIWDINCKNKSSMSLLKGLYVVFEIQTIDEALTKTQEKK